MCTNWGNNVDGLLLSPGQKSKGTKPVLSFAWVQWFDCCSLPLANIQHIEQRPMRQ